MHEPVIRSGDHILVGDGKKILLFENCGNALSPKFKMIQQMHNADPRGFSSILSSLDKKHIKGQISRLHIVAPPKALGGLRDSMSRSLKQCVVSEVDKDLTGLPVKNIERNLRQAS
jgi:protein required for attachment to host cells